MRYRFAWADAAQVVETEEPDLAARLGRFLALAPEPCPKPAQIRIEPGVGGYRVITPYGAGGAGSRDDLVYLALECLAYGFLEETGACVAHAGAFETDAGAIVYFGAPRAGKSALSVAAWRRGREVIGDDRIVLAPEAGTAAAFPKCVKLRLAPDARPDPLSGTVPEALGVAGTLHGDRRFILARALPRMAAYGAPRPIRALVSLERDENASGARLDPLGARRAFDVILPQVISPRLDPLAILRLIKSRAEAGGLFRLVVGRGHVEAALDRLLAIGSEIGSGG